MSEKPAVEFSFSPVLWLDEAPSTNDLIKEELSAKKPILSGNVIAVRRQTKGRGRMAAVWESAQQGDLTFSFYWQGRCRPIEAGSLSMACALGVRDFLAEFGVTSRCKWPNDVMAGDGKICGILAEGGANGKDEFGLVMGIGINIRHVAGRNERFGRSTAALEDFAEVQIGVEELLVRVLACLEARIRLWEKGGYAALRSDLLGCQWGVGREVSARVPGGRIVGVVLGLGEAGELLLRTAEGRKCSVASVSALEGWEA